MKTNRGNISGFILIFAGVVLLLNTSGILDWGVWNIILQFWPVLLILAGLRLFFGKTALLMNMIIVVVLVSIGVYAVGLSHQGFNRWLRNRVPFFPTQPFTPQKDVLPPVWYQNDL